jgi:hypothetical protein
MRMLSAMRSIVVALLACFVGVLPSCASMGGGGMKGMFSEPVATAPTIPV